MYLVTFWSQFWSQQQEVDQQAVVEYQSAPISVGKPLPNLMVI
jgi:hypothetical protein